MDAVNYPPRTHIPDLLAPLTRPIEPRRGRWRMTRSFEFSPQPKKNRIADRVDSPTRETTADRGLPGACTYSADACLSELASHVLEERVEVDSPPGLTETSWV